MTTSRSGSFWGRAEQPRSLGYAVASRACRRSSPQAQLYGSFVAVKIPRNQVSKQKENANFFQEVFLLFLKEGIMLKCETPRLRLLLIESAGLFSTKTFVVSLVFASGRWKGACSRSCSSRSISKVRSRGNREAEVFALQEVTYTVSLRMVNHTLSLRA